MTRTAPSFLLSAAQAERLLLYMQEYRRLALRHQLPTSERNTTLRLVQALQGKLLAFCDQKAPQICLILAREEMTALKAMTKSLLLIYGTMAASPERTSTIADLANLYAYVNHTCGCAMSSSSGVLKEGNYDA